MQFSRLRRKNNDLMLKKPSEDVIKAHNEAEIIIKENDVDRFLLNIFMDKKGINHYNTSPELVNEFLSSNWFLNIDFKCLLQIDNQSKRIRTYAHLTEKELIFKEDPYIVISLVDVLDCKIDGKKVDIIVDEVRYRIMFTNKNLAKLFFDYIISK